MRRGNVVFRRWFFRSLVLSGMWFVLVGPVATREAVCQDTAVTNRILLLDGTWLLVPDPNNIGREQEWWREPQPGAKETPVPWIIQDAFPDYHGVAWYWRDFTAPVNPHEAGRYLLRFWAVDYKADVWVNDTYIGSHEGGEDPFVLDATEAVVPGAVNHMAVRVLNPTDEPIDGIVLKETPHQVKDGFLNIGGIVESVELLVTPPVRIRDLFVMPEYGTGRIRIRTEVDNALEAVQRCQLVFTVAPAGSGETLDVVQWEKDVPPGQSVLAAELHVSQPRPWDIDDPFLYRVTIRIERRGSNSFDEQSTRCGFRDFRFQNGYFRLNGRRIFWRSAHTGNFCPVGIFTTRDPELLRRDLLNLKIMGFNGVRYIAGVARPRRVLDLCDEIGLMVYEECYAGWYLKDSPWMAERFDHAVRGMIRRDRNHPSIVMWGLLNESFGGEVFHHAVSTLPLVRALDDTRLVMLNSGRPDGYTQARTLKDIDMWRTTSSPEYNVTYNPTDKVITQRGSTWQPHQLALHPGVKGEYSVIRWRAPADGEYTITAEFTGIARPHTTVDVHIYGAGEPLFQDFINLNGRGDQVDYSGRVRLHRGDRLDVVVGPGTDDPFGDTTALKMTITSGEGWSDDVVKDFSLENNPNGRWTYGYLAPGEEPDLDTFKAYDVKEPDLAHTIGSLSNPGSQEWEDVLSDLHTYPGAPHSASTIHMLRTTDGGKPPVFISEYGVGSAVDLARLDRLYEQIHASHAGDARFYHGKYVKFMEDWERWKLAETFGRPDDFFRQSNAMMGRLRLFGINALRANPNVVGYSLTGAVDQGLSGEGLTTTFRELKPGTVDALFDGLAPLRWCLFAEPLNVRRSGTVRLEAVLANEDVLSPGEYPVRLDVFGPAGEHVWQHRTTVTIPEVAAPEPPFALPVFSEEIVIDGQEGKYRFTAAFEKKAAALGGQIDFHVWDPAVMPATDTEVVLWGEAPRLARWLREQGIATTSYNPEGLEQPRVILVSEHPPAPGTRREFKRLAYDIARGSVVIFLSPKVFYKKSGWFGWDDEPLGWLPLRSKGEIKHLMNIGLYHPEHWNKRHPIFAGLPNGGLMDYMVYRNVLVNEVWSGQDPPDEAVAGATFVVFSDYASGLMVAVYKLGAGRFILNTLALESNLGKDPVAERILRNMIRYAARNTAAVLQKVPDDFDEQLVRIGY